MTESLYSDDNDHQYHKRMTPPSFLELTDNNPWRNGTIKNRQLIMFLSSSIKVWPIKHGALSLSLIGAANPGKTWFIAHR